MAKPSEIVTLLGSSRGSSPSDPWATALAARLLGYAAQARWTDARDVADILDLWLSVEPKGPGSLYVNGLIRMGMSMQRWPIAARIAFLRRHLGDRRITPSDEADAGWQRNGWLTKTLTVLSLDVTLPFASQLGIDPAQLAAVQPELRTVLGPGLDVRLADPLAQLEGTRLVDALGPSARALLRSFYDRAVRYEVADDVALFTWGTVLMRHAKDDALWRSLNLPAERSEELRKAFWASMEWSDIQEELDALFAKPLSDWDRRVAVTGLLPPEDEGQLGIGDQTLLRLAEVVRRQQFWRTVASELGEAGMATLRRKCQAFLESQPDIAKAFGQLYDPWLLAHPEIVSRDPWHPS
jgi:hypothetical protein